MRLTSASRTTFSRVLLALFWICAALCCGVSPGGEPIPLAEHPRPDFQRSGWLNLNGPWQFRFDAADAGLKEKWFDGATPFPRTVVVPFPWGSALSQVADEAELAWYSRTVQVPQAWQGQRVFLIIGACDWETQVWLDGQPLGTHRGGYTPFEFELTPRLQPGGEGRLTLRVDDRPRPFKLEGKQGYGNARGIWQTVYLEARPQAFLKSVQFSPDVDRGLVAVRAELSAAAAANTSVKLRFNTGDLPELSQAVAEGAEEVRFEVAIPTARLWSLEDPFLYEVEAALQAGDQADRVGTYFGMRKISVVNLPGRNHPYIALNNRPIYLRMTLDQSYHPEGFYAFPSDEFMRDEILRSRRIGLNANRLHVKIDVPRKLYWADRLGLLLMCDVPNSWGEPSAEMRGEIEHALRGMLRRDFNHPSIFCWVPFNETWGLFTKQGDKRVYLPETQQWVASMYRLAKQLDSTRLVEDNSPCNHDHVATDINSWHAYLPGYEWAKHLDQVTADTFAGSKWNFVAGQAQGAQPLLNSECGNVWGYQGSTGDVDWSWDYHIMMNEFRRHPQVCGWLYTEHHDVINEWNGYYRYDRSEKETGLEELASGMTLRDLHSPLYVSTGSELCRDAKPGERVSVPLWLSFLTGSAPSPGLRLQATLAGWDHLGRRQWFSRSVREIAFQPWLSKEVEPLAVTMPETPCLAVLTLSLEDQAGMVLHRNFTTFRVADGPAPRQERIHGDRQMVLLRFAPSSFTAAEWSLKQWNVLEGLKVNGAGHGYFEYRVAWPEGVDAAAVQGASLVFEASAKQLFGKDREGATPQDGDFMRGKGTHDPSRNPNSYPMTDTVRFPTAVGVRVSGQSAGWFDLPDDPADHRGILSWHAQLRDRKLREAGSHGYLVEVTIPASAVRAACAAKEFVVRLEVDASLPGGLALYGERFGRYPLDPTIVLSVKD